MNTNGSITEPARWGLSLTEIQQLGERLRHFYDRYRTYFRTATRDTSDYGLEYLSGLLRMEANRTMANIGRKTAVPEQNMQHFISNSPWSGERSIIAVQDEVKVHPEFQGGALLILDESANEKAGPHSAGAGRQYNGRLGKIEMSQVGVFLSLATARVHTWIDGKLFLPEHWFTEAAAEKRRRAGVPDDRQFQTKPELGWQMIQQAQAKGVPFDAVLMDELYGRKADLRRDLHQAGIEYYADIPANTRVFLDEPFPETSQENSPSHYAVQELRDHPALERATIPLRPNERGLLTAEFARCRVWLIYDGHPRQEWLLLRYDPNAMRVTYVLSNATVETPLETMAWRKTHRYFIERDNQDAKSEFGWDEFQATKYRAWQHQLALTVLASWFVAETRLDWMARGEQDPTLLVHFQVEVLPLLSVANVRELLRAALPLPQLSPQEATDLVVKHLVNRTRSRRSRLKRRDRLREM